MPRGGVGVFGSLRGRLILLLVLVTAAAVAAGSLVVELFRQSATARAGQAETEIGRACEAIVRSCHRLSDGKLRRRELTATVEMALRAAPGIEGGIWRDVAGSLAYDSPTHQGAGPKTDVPEA